MCVVSMIGDFYGKKWQPWEWGQAGQPTYPPFPTVFPTEIMQPVKLESDVAALRKEVLEMKELLKKAIEYDRVHNQPHCEQEDKMKFLREVAKSVGISLDDVIGKGV